MNAKGERNESQRDRREDKNRDRDMFVVSACYE
jgi:hypothetical protein